MTYWRQKNPYRRTPRTTPTPHAVSKEQVGLGNADNTSDMDKPVSIAQQNAILDVLTKSGAYTDNKIADLFNGALKNIIVEGDAIDNCTVHGKKISEQLNSAGNGSSITYADAEPASSLTPGMTWIGT